MFLSLKKLRLREKERGSETGFESGEVGKRKKESISPLHSEETIFCCQKELFQFVKLNIQNEEEPISVAVRLVCGCGCGWGGRGGEEKREIEVRVKKIFYHSFSL